MADIKQVEPKINFTADAIYDEENQVHVRVIGGKESFSGVKLEGGKFVKYRDGKKVGDYGRSEPKAKEPTAKSEK